jgi:hypothetical protein
MGTLKAGFCALVLVLATAGHGASAEPDTSNPAHLRAFLRHHFLPARGPVDRTTRITVARARTRGGEQILVYVQGQTHCGTSGCELLVLEPHGSTYRVVGDTSLLHPAVRVLKTLHFGRPDLGVVVAGGGVIDAYEVRLSFNGTKYPEDTNGMPRIAWDTGEVVIPTRAYGSLLY